MLSGALRKYGLSFLLGACLVFMLLLASSCDNEDVLDLDETAMTNDDIVTCTDGIMNGDETGIDCGGACTPCEAGEELGRRAELYVTNNANGDISRYSVTGDSLTTFTTASTAAEGIYYSSKDGVLVQASRSGLQLDAYSGIAGIMEDSALDASFSSTTDLESPRELAVNGDMYVVSDNGSNKFFVYTKNGDSFSLTSTVEIPFPVWGITFRGSDLYAVVDNSSDLAVFNNFQASISAPVCALNPSKRVVIEGIVRTHGLVYNAADDIMIMTDIGDAANTTDDGAFHVISEFAATFDLLSDGEVYPLSRQVRVAGPSTMMGNPIDVAYDSEENAVYISEVGNGKVLGFTAQGGGDRAPWFVKDLPAASSIYFSSDETDDDLGEEAMAGNTVLYATSTANGNIYVYDAMGNALKTVTSQSESSEGIYYTALDDILVQASRSALQLEGYAEFSTVPDGAIGAASFTSSKDLMSPREIAVYGNKIVVADNAENIFYVYSHDMFSFSLINTFRFECRGIWGITFKGDDLLAVVDNTGDLAIFSDFFTNYTVDGNITPEKIITIQGIVRTHGIDYSAADDLLVMTDIGDAANGTDDGGFQLIQEFSAKLDAISNGGTLVLSDQTRVSGPGTMMGNPIDIAYDNDSKTVYIAEIGNGKILGFSDVLNASGDVAPTFNWDLNQASSIFLYNN
ncbi:hypothetical protein FGM00_04485 [Aggregatimonas sangjinii]|uniref:Uncharacterized protein n=1 Tax=Aggregatimonas sangjinii TaxID=2583587 RepID=A0A5B7SYJ7_9FLAO|nr:hypothetical protein FGM00_04485 [Aggregatimonas sangjinii]